MSSTPASVSVIGLALKMIVPTTAAATAPINTPPSTAKCPPLGVTAQYANTLPGEGVATKPAPVIWNQRSAEIPPAHILRIIIGCPKTYGK